MTSAIASVSFRLNGKPVEVKDCSTHTTLLSWLRHACHTGTKEGCAEGDCGACTVVVVEHSEAGAVYRSLNSCIALLVSFHGKELYTVEGLETERGLHPVQDAMIACGGSQCGYCTPGFVMSMFEGYYRDDLQTAAQTVDQLNGNLCRCTGYRPIRDAMNRALRVKKNAAGEDLFDLRTRKQEVAPPSFRYEHANAVRAQHERYLRPTSLAELLTVRAVHPEAELVAGATEIGVYINKRRTHYPMLIGVDGVRELAAFRTEVAHWEVGGGMTLTALDDALGEALPMLRKMLWAFASRPVRNRATVAGNLVTASPIGDLAPVLLALDASVVLASTAGTRVVPLASFFTGYRKTVLAQSEVLLSVRVPKPRAGAQLASYKISKRRELDISIVSAAFALECASDGTVTSVRLAYGGIAATPARAVQTEAVLLGRPWNQATLDLAKATLAGEFTPLNDVRSGARFRAGAAQTLLQKFFDGATSEAQDVPFVYEEGAHWSAQASTEGAVEDASRALHHESARGHVTGAAQYVDDVARARPMLDAWPVLSPHAHARIVRADFAAARKVPGVVQVLTAADVPALNDVGAIRHDEPLFADGEVLFAGQLVAVVIAESLEAARAGAAAAVVEYEVLPSVLELREAIARGHFHTTGHRIARGDAASALSTAPHRLQGEVVVGGQEHFYLESQASWAECTDDGGVHVCSSTQHPSEVQAIVSHVLGVARSLVVVEAPRMGGGFGGKETQGAAFAAVCALGATKTGKPVRMQLDRDVDMTMTGKRHPFLFQYEVGYTAEGLLLGLNVKVYNDGGYALDLSESICDRALFHIDNAYFIPNVEIFGRVAKTHTVSHTAFRGFGGPQGMVCIEHIMDHIARTLGLRPEDVRERNLYTARDARNVTPYGQTVEDDRAQRVFRELRAESNLDARRLEIDAFNARNPHVKRGIALTPVKFGISFTATFLNQAGALMHIYRDGSVQLNHGGTEMGQGLHSKMLGVAMRELGLPREAIRMMKTRTDKVPNTSATAASAGADLNGQAVKAACETLRERLLPFARTLLEKAGAAPGCDIRFAEGYLHGDGFSVPFAQVVEAAYFGQVSLSATGYYRTPDIGYDRTIGKGKPFYYFAYGAAVSEVEVDGYTGMKRVRRVDILHDVGDSLNPGIDRGQIEGAFVQGMGWLTSEELKWNDKGVLLSHSASTYQIPSFGDAPPDFRVRLLDRAAQPGVVHGSKAVGEPPLMLALSVREAIRDAIAAFGEHAKTDLPSPLTHEVIFHAVQP